MVSVVFVMKLSLIFVVRHETFFNFKSFQRPNQTETFAIPKLLFDLMGLNRKSPYPELYKTIAFSTIVLGFSTMIVTTSLNLYRRPQDLFSFNFVLLNLIKSLTEVVNYRVNCEKYEGMLNMLEDPLMASYSEKHDGYLRKWIRNFRIFSLSYIGSTMVLCSSMILYSYFREDEEHRLLYPIYVPFDIQENFLLIHCLQMVFMINGGNCQTCTDAIFGGLTWIGAFQFRLLKDRILSIESTLSSSDNQGEEIGKKLKDAVRHHQILLRFAQFLSFSSLIEKYL